MAKIVRLPLNQMPIRRLVQPNYSHVHVLMIYSDAVFDREDVYAMLMRATVGSAIKLSRSNQVRCKQAIVWYS